MSNKKIDGIGLSIFRIVFFTALFFEVKHMYYFKELFYDPFSKIVSSDINWGVTL